MFTGLTLPRFSAAWMLLALSATVAAQETCGVTVVVYRDGFEAGSLPGYVPPPDSTPLSMSVTFPGEGATVGTEQVVLAGNFTGPANIGITVNGELAASTNTGFVSRPIQLLEGANAITVQLHTIDGIGPTVVRNVTYDPAAAAQAAIDALSASAEIPGAVLFQVSKRSGEPLSITRVQLDFDGDGTFDIDTPSTTNLTFTYRTPGLFTIQGVATLDDADPQTPAVQVPLTARALASHPLQSRFALCSLFGTMRTRLAAQDINGALNALGDPLRPPFQTLWTDLGSQLPAAAAQLGTIVDGVFSSEVADYIVARPISGQPGQSRAYRVQFERTELGVWRISGM